MPHPMIDDPMADDPMTRLLMDGRWRRALALHAQDVRDERVEAGLGHVERARDGRAHRDLDREDDVAVQRLDNPDEAR